MLKFAKNAWAKTKQAVQVGCEKVKGAALAVVGTAAGLLGLGASDNASAVVTLDPAIATGFTTVQDNFAALLSLAYPYMITIVTGLIIFGLVKMFIHKGAGK